MTIKHIHGIADAGKFMMFGPVDCQRVTVTDGDGYIVLSKSDAAAATLTPDQADEIAGHLIAAAGRMRALTAGRK